MRSTPTVVVVGGGLAGLSCARHLSRAGVGVKVLEAADDVGGRVRTDAVEGFLLDRGFQVLLTAYPECQRELDYGRLKLKPFFPGALVRVEGQFHRVADPWSQPSVALRSVFAPVGSFGDKLRVARLRQRVGRMSVQEIFRRPERTTQQALRSEGFSDEMIDRFFRPFLGGIFLENELQTSSRMFEFVFKMFSEGQGVLPSAGMQAIPAQLAASLPAGTISTNARVVECGAGKVRLDNGASVTADAVVIAADAAAAETLAPTVGSREWRSTVCVYYAALEAPVATPILVLNGEGTGPINNLCVPSHIVPDCAPAGQSLVSVTVLGSAKDGDVEPGVRAQLKAWFGHQVDDWRHLRSYHIQHALPAQPPGVLEPSERTVRSDGGSYVCGDHVDNASIQGAMVSGRRAAEAVLADLGHAVG